MGDVARYKRATSQHLITCLVDRDAWIATKVTLYLIARMF
jgi:hypothetical protein